MIPGCDVHVGYGDIDWRAVAASGVRFAYVRCTEGNEPGRDDSRFSKNISGCMANGIAVGAYHVAWTLPEDARHPGRSPREQAKRFCDRSGRLGSLVGDLAPVLDCEWPPPHKWAEWGVDAPFISAWLRVCCAEIEDLWQVRPVIYTYPDYWKHIAAHADVEWAADYDLWIANYVHPGPGMPPDSVKPIVPHPWTDWTVLQYSADGSKEGIPGIHAVPVDRDCIRNEATLRRLMRMPAAPTEPPPPDFDVVHPRVPLEHPDLDELDDPGDAA